MEKRDPARGGSGPVVIESLTLEEPRPGLLELSGSLQSRSAQADLSAHFERIHKTTLAGKLPVITIDVRNLALVSSSAIRLFVSWTSRAEASGYRMVFIIDHSVTWHRLSFSVLESLAPGTVEIVDRNGAARGVA
jgi:anti-anti-sigma regulatory factor